MPATTTRPIELRSDNAAGVAPEILAAVSGADVGSALAYGADEWTARMEARVREVFEHDGARVFPVSSGTAANALGLSAMCPPWGAVLCHETAHILRTECGATSMFGGGAALVGVPGSGGRIDPAALETALRTARWGDPHQSQPTVVSVTCPSDLGTLTSAEHLAELARIGAAHGLRAHLDGARMANALVALGCSPAALTWRAGVDTFTLGATKNGALSTDAIVTFDAATADQLVYRTKRAGHVASKMRFQSVQLDAYLTDGLWLRLARRANEAMARLVGGLTAIGVEPIHEVRANMAYVRLPDAAVDGLTDAGLLFYRMGEASSGSSRASRPPTRTSTTRSAASPRCSPRTPADRPEGLTRRDLRRRRSDRRTGETYPAGYYRRARGRRR